MASKPAKSKMTPAQAAAALTLEILKFAKKRVGDPVTGGMPTIDRWADEAAKEMILAAGIITMIFEGATKSTIHSCFGLGKIEDNIRLMDVINSVTSKNPTFTKTAWLHVVDQTIERLEKEFKPAED